MFPVVSSIYYRMPTNVVDAFPPPYDVSLQAERRKMAPIPPPLTLSVGRFPVDCRTPPYHTTSTPSPVAEQLGASRWTTATPGSVSAITPHPATSSAAAADDMTSSPAHATSSSPSSSSSPPQPDDVIKPILKFGVNAILSPDFASRARTSSTINRGHTSLLTFEVSC